MSLWATGDIITAARLNQKELFIGASAPASPTDGQLWYDTTNRMLKWYDASAAIWRQVTRITFDTAANKPATGATTELFVETDTDRIYRGTGTGWAALAQAVDTNKVSAPPPTVEEYATPTSVSVSHEYGKGPHRYKTVFGNYLRGTALKLYLGYDERAAQRVTINARVKAIGFALYRVGSPPGTVYFRIRALDDTILAEASMPASEVVNQWGGYAGYKLHILEFSTPVSINAEVRVSVEYADGDANNCVAINYTSDWNVGNWSRYRAGAWSEETTYDLCCIVLDVEDDATSSFDFLHGWAIGDYMLDLVAGGYTRACMRAKIEGTLLGFSLLFGKDGSPTGTAYARVRRVADDSVLAEQSIDVATAPKVGMTHFTFNLPLNEEVRICFEFEGGDGTNHLHVYNAGREHETFADVVGERYATAWEAAQYCAAWTAVYKSGASSNTIDNDTTTFWQPGALSSLGYLASTTYVSKDNSTIYRVAQRIDLTGKAIRWIKVKLGKISSPGWTRIYIRIRRVTDDSIIHEHSIAQYQGFDLSEVVCILFLHSALKIDEEVRVCVESNTPAGYGIAVYYEAADVITGYYSQHDGTTWTDDTTKDMNIEIGYDTTVTNPYVTWDLTGTTIAGVSGLRVYWPSDAAWRPTSYKFQCDVYVFSTFYSQTQADRLDNLNAGSAVRRGQKLSVNAKVKKVTVKLGKIGAPTGTVYCRIRRTADDSILQTSPTTLDAATLPVLADGYDVASAKDYDFDFDVDVNEEVYVLIEFDGGNINNNVWIAVATSDVAAGVHVYYTTAYYEVATWDTYLKLYGKVQDWEDIAQYNVDPGAGWSEYSFIATECRFLRLIILTHGTSGTRVNEMDYYQASIWKHGHVA